MSIQCDRLARHSLSIHFGPCCGHKKHTKQKWAYFQFVAVQPIIQSSPSKKSQLKFHPMLMKRIISFTTCCSFHSYKKLESAILHSNKNLQNCYTSQYVSMYSILNWTKKKLFDCDFFLKYCTVFLLLLSSELRSFFYEYSVLGKSEAVIHRVRIE